VAAELADRLAQLALLGTGAVEVELEVFDGLQCPEDVAVPAEPLGCGSLGGTSGRLRDDAIGVSGLVDSAAFLSQVVLLEDHLHARGINLHILSGICAGTHRPDGATMADKMLFMVTAMAAEMERDLIRERTLDGLRAAQSTAGSS
jgi:hypothetical protein